jgi:type I restriction enzyme, S subunit
LLEGHLEFSVLMYSEIDKIKIRLDSEYYQKKFLELEIKINEIGQSTINSIKGELDCSAFYPSITEDYDFTAKGVPFLRVNEIQNGLITITENTAFLPQHILDNNTSTIKIAYPDDIVIAKGGNTLAKLGIVTNQYPYYALCRDLILMKTGSIKNCNKYYLWVFLHSDLGQSLLWRTASQTGQPHLTLPAIGEIGIPRFSSRFENLFEDIYIKSLKTKSKSKLIYSKAENILLEVLGLKDFEPCTDGVNVKGFKESFLSTGRLDAEYYQKKYEDIEQIIRQSDTFKLKDVFDLLSNTSPSEYTESGIKVIKTKNIRIPNVEIENITDHTNDKCLLVQQNDLLFASMGVGSLGRISYIDCNITNCTTDGTIKIFRCKDAFKNRNVEIPTLLFLTSSYGQELIYKFVIGSTGIISIGKDNIENLLIPKIDYEIAANLTNMVLDSQSLKKESEQLLEFAKKAVEIAIEEGEEKAMNYIKNKVINE